MQRQLTVPAVKSGLLPEVVDIDQGQTWESGEDASQGDGKQSGQIPQTDIQKAGV